VILYKKFDLKKCRTDVRDFPEKVKAPMFRMQEPKEQAELFKLLSSVLYYLASGYSKVGFLAAAEWNTHYKVEYGLDV
jgi:hypothetical protein